VSRHTIVTCDHCLAEISGEIITFNRDPNGPHISWEGMLYSWQFCSKEHLLLWLAPQAAAQLSQPEPK
jgi:hypothetical protein